MQARGVERPAIRRTESQISGARGNRLFRREWLPADPERVLLLVHGLAEHSGRYEHVGAWFAARGCVVHAYDQQGHGKSAGIRGHVRRFSDYLDDLELMLRFVRERHPELPVFLVGHSMGGLVVASFARERGPEVAGAVTSGAALRLSDGVSGAKIFAVRVLSRLFRRRFLQALNHAFQKGQLGFHGAIEALAEPHTFAALLDDCRSREWVVHAKPPFAGPDTVLDYLARYTHRVAIANSRIMALKDGMVTFKIKNRKENRTEQVTVTAVEFIRRFLLHSLPRGFVRIRHYGFLANRNRSKNLTAIRRLMGVSDPPEKHFASVEEMMHKLTGIDISLCPGCHKGRMQLFLEIPKGVARPPNPLVVVAA